MCNNKKRESPLDTTTTYKTRLLLYNIRYNRERLLDVTITHKTQFLLYSI